MILGIIEFIREHPGLVAGVFGVIWTILSALIFQVHTRVGKRLDEMEEKIVHMENKVVGVEKNYIQRLDAISLNIEKMRLDIIERIHDLELKLIKQPTKGRSEWTGKR